MIAWHTLSTSIYYCICKKNVAIIMYIIMKNYATEDDSMREDDVYCCNIMPMKIWRNTSVREIVITH